MVIKLLQQSTFRRYAAKVLSPFFYFCCFRCVTVPLTGVINYVFCIYFIEKLRRIMAQLNTWTWKTSTNTPTNTLHISRSPHGHGATAVGLTWDDCALSVRFYGYCTGTARQPYDDCAMAVRMYHDSTIAVRFVFNNISTESRAFSARSQCGVRTTPVYGDCAMAATICRRATGLRFLKICITFLYKIVEWIRPWIRTKISRQSTEAAPKERYGQFAGSVDTSQVKCKRGLIVLSSYIVTAVSYDNNGLDLVYICHGRRAITSSAIFRTVLGDIICGSGYGVCVYIIHDYRAIFEQTLGGLIGTNPYGGCAEIAPQSCNFSAVTSQSPRAFYGIVRSPCGFRAEDVRRRYGYVDDVDHLLEYGWLDSEVWYEVATRFPHQFQGWPVSVSMASPRPFSLFALSCLLLFQNDQGCNARLLSSRPTHLPRL